jgi:hypothetical protein
MPYLDQLGGALLLDPASAWDAPENCPVRIRRSIDDDFSREGLGEEKFTEDTSGEVKCWICPANLSRTGLGMPAVTHYVGIAGVGEEAPYLPAGHPRAGVFGHDRCTSLQEIRRGTGHTLMVMETSRRNGPWTAGGPPTVRGVILRGRPSLGTGGQFGGIHRGGGWALFADGSVRFLPDSINGQVFETLATVRGGSPAGDD